MRRISIVTPKSLDALGRIIAVTRRAKVQLVDKLPEVLKIDEGNIDINY
jgi:hypothetical protein